MIANRFSRPTQVAKFDPITSETLLKVPLAKQALEDEQRATVNETLKEMYNMTSLEADAPRVNAKKAQLKEEMDALVNDITKNGVNTRSTQRLLQLKDMYNKELSLSGEIGHANAFVAKRDKAAEEFLKTADKRYGASINKYLDEKRNSMSAFGKDGSGNDIYNTTASINALPEYYDLEETFMKAAKDAGYIEETINGHVIRHANIEQLEALRDSILSTVNMGTSEAQSLLIQGKVGIDGDKLDTKAAKDVLDNLIDVFNVSKTGSLFDTSGKTTEAQKNKIEKELEDAAKAASTGLAEGNKILMPFGKDVSVSKLRDEVVFATKQIADLEQRLKADPDNKALKKQLADAEDLLKLTQVKEKHITDIYNTQTDEGKVLQEELSKAEKELPPGVIDKEYYKTTGDDGHYYYPVMLAQALLGVDDQFDDPKKAAEYVGKNPDKMTDAELKSNLKSVNNYIEKKTNYIQGLDSYLRKESLMEFIPVYNPLFTDDSDLGKQWNGYQKLLFDTMQSAQSGFNIDFIEYNDNGEMKREAVSEKDAALLKHYFKTDGVKAKIQGITTPSGTREAGGVITLDIPKSVADASGSAFIKKLGEQGISVGFQIDPNVQTAYEMMTTKLAETGSDDAKAMAQGIIDVREYRDVIPGPSVKPDTKYMNSDNIEEYYASSKGAVSKGSIIFASKQSGSASVKTDVYANKDGSISIGYGSKGTTPISLTVSELYRATMAQAESNDPTEQKQAAIASNYLYRKYASKVPGLPSKPVEPTEVQLETYKEELQKWYDKVVEEISNNNEPATFNNTTELFKILN